MWRGSPAELAQGSGKASIGASQRRVDAEPGRTAWRATRERSPPRTLSERPGLRASASEWRRCVAEDAGPEVFPDDRA
ncbi:MAG TPA: hypothetical protein VGF67_17340 [Ktedonobacteraceae bacterium]